MSRESRAGGHIKTAGSPAAERDGREAPELWVPGCWGSKKIMGNGDPRLRKRSGKTGLNEAVQGGREREKKSPELSQGLGGWTCKQEPPREGAGMDRAANAPGSSPPQQGAGSREGGAGRGEHQPPLSFFGICLSAVLSKFLCFSLSSPGKGRPAQGFSPSCAHTSQVQFKENQAEQGRKGLGCPEPESPHS